MFPLAFLIFNVNFSNKEKVISNIMKAKIRETSYNYIIIGKKCVHFLSIIKEEVKQ